MSFYFSDLPSELRDMIHDEVWKRKFMIMVHCQRLSLYVLHRNAYEETSLLRSNSVPPWLRTSRQILREGLEQSCFIAHGPEHLAP
jgi:hypothetical protein